MLIPTSFLLTRSAYSGRKSGLHGTRLDWRVHGMGGQKFRLATAYSVNLSL